MRLGASPGPNPGVREGGIEGRSLVELEFGYGGVERAARDIRSRPSSKRLHPVTAGGHPGQSGLRPHRLKTLT